MTATTINIIQTTMNSACSPPLSDDVPTIMIAKKNDVSSAMTCHNLNDTALAISCSCDWWVFYACGIICVTKLLPRSMSISTGLQWSSLEIIDLMSG